LVFNSKEFSLFPLRKGILSWGRALGPLGGLSTAQLNCCLHPHGREEQRREEAPGRRFVSTTDATIAAVDSLMRSDRRVMG